MMNNFFRDVQFGLRLIFKERVVTAVVVLTLALAIGVTSPIVSLVGSVFLRSVSRFDAIRRASTGCSKRRAPRSTSNTIA